MSKYFRLQLPRTLFAWVFYSLGVGVYVFEWLLIESTNSCMDCLTETGFPLSFWEHGWAWSPYQSHVYVGRLIFDLCFFLVYIAILYLAKSLLSKFTFWKKTIYSLIFFILLSVTLFVSAMLANEYRHKYFPVQSIVMETVTIFFGGGFLYGEVT